MNMNLTFLVAWLTIIVGSNIDAYISLVYLLQGNFLLLCTYHVRLCDKKGDTLSVPIPIIPLLFYLYHSELKNITCSNS